MPTTPLWLELVKAFHVMGGVVMLGLSVASYFYVMNSIKQRDIGLVIYSLRLSYFFDLAFVPLILWQILSAFILIRGLHLSLQIPWIVIAFVAFALLTLLWGAALIIKMRYTLKLPQRVASSGFVWGFSALYVVLWLVYALIIHDAILHKTWFEWLVIRMLA